MLSCSDLHLKNTIIADDMNCKIICTYTFIILIFYKNLLSAY